MRVLFVIHDLGNGGAEKVLVNLVNNMDKNHFDITVLSLFKGGINEQFLDKRIRYQTIFPKGFRGNIHLLKLFNPQRLHRLMIKEDYDIEISYLEGPSARIVSGCQNKKTKLISWIHVEQHNMKKVSRAFRSEREAVKCYNTFDKIVCVSEYVKNDFCNVLNYMGDACVLYNTVDSKRIRELSEESVPLFADNNDVKLIAVGTLKKSKGYLRLLNVIERLLADQFPIHLYILGEGPQRKEIEEYIADHELTDNVSLLGYDTNPYKYVAKADLFVCSSYAEGFSTAVTESLIVGTPVVTVDVSGMKELLGANNEYGIVTDNDEESLYEGIKKLLSSEDLLLHYAKMSKIRGEHFETMTTVKEVEKLLGTING